MDDLAGDLEARLRRHGSRERAEAEGRYLKSELVHVGVPVPVIRKTVLAVHREHDLSHDALVELVVALWGRGIHELRVAAVELLRAGVSELSADDAALLETLLRQARTWALVDPMAVGVAGALLEAEPETWEPVVRRWAVDPDHWLRRSALLAHLPGLRGEGSTARAAFARFGALADPMLEEREFFIRKAIGWVLRDTARRHPGLVRDWLAPRADRAAGLTIREAVKHLPDADRARILARRDQAKRPPRGR